MVGLARKPVMDGVYQHPSCWILDTVYRLGQAQNGQISAKAVGGWAPGSLYTLLDWPKDWVGHRPPMDTTRPVSSMCWRHGSWQPLSCAAGMTWPRSPMRS
eukprot:2745566-Amphidinium_carterae.1